MSDIVQSFGCQRTQIVFISDYMDCDCAFTGMFAQVGYGEYMPMNVADLNRHVGRKFTAGELIPYFPEVGCNIGWELDFEGNGPSFRLSFYLAPDYQTAMRFVRHRDFPYWDRPYGQAPTDPAGTGEVQGLYKWAAELGCVPIELVYDKDSDLVLVVPMVKGKEDE